MTNDTDDPRQDPLQNNSSDHSGPAPATPPSTLPESLILQTISAYDDLGEVTALHRWVYDALHAQLVSDMNVDADYHEFGLSLLLSWLKCRDQTAKNNIKQVLERMQALHKADNIEDPPALYCV